MMRIQMEEMLKDYPDETSSSVVNALKELEELNDIWEKEKEAEKEVEKERKREKKREKKKKEEEREASSHAHGGDMQAQPASFPQASSAISCDLSQSHRMPATNSGSGVLETMVQTHMEEKCKDYTDEMPSSVANALKELEELDRSWQKEKQMEEKCKHYPDEMSSSVANVLKELEELDHSWQKEAAKRKEGERDASSQAHSGEMQVQPASFPLTSPPIACDLSQSQRLPATYSRSRVLGPMMQTDMEEKCKDYPKEPYLVENELKIPDELKTEETEEVTEKKRDKKKKKKKKETEASSRAHGGKMQAQTTAGASSYAMALPETPDHGQDQVLVAIGQEDTLGELYQENEKMKKLELCQAEEGEKLEELCQKERESPEDMEKVKEKLEELCKTSSTLVPTSDDEFLQTKAIEFLGRSRRIVLQDKNGPCSLIAICNYLILTDQMILTEQRVKFQVLLDDVFTRVFRLMKNENYEAVKDALMQTATGLDIDLLFERFDSFGDNIRYSIFKTLSIPLYHAWVFDPKDPLTVSFTEAEFIDNSHSQITQYGLFQLQSAADLKQLFVLFRNNHFGIVYKHKSELYNLETDVSFLTIDRMWQRIEDVKGNGDYVSSSFFNPQLKIPRSEISRVRQQQPSNKRKVPRVEFPRYKLNNVQYYKLIVRSMRDLGSSEMRVYYDHIQDFDWEFAQALCNCHSRVREHLNHAASNFIEYLKPELGFECKTPHVRIVELPQPHRKYLFWIST